MAENDYKELIDFFGKQLEQIHNEIAQVNTNLENKIEEKIEETKRHVDILFEDVQHKFEITAEGMAAINEKLDRFHEENEREHSGLEKMALVNTADISSLDQRVGRLESKF